MVGRVAIVVVVIAEAVEGGFRRDQSRVGFELKVVVGDIDSKFVTDVDIGVVPIVVTIDKFLGSVIVLLFSSTVDFMLSVSFKLIVVIEGTVKGIVVSLDEFRLIVTLDGPLEVVVDGEVVLGTSTNLLFDTS